MVDSNSIERRLTPLARWKIRCHANTLRQMRTSLTKLEIDPEAETNPRVKRALKGSLRSAVTDFAQRCGGTPEEISHDILEPMGLLEEKTLLNNLKAKITQLRSLIIRR